MHTHIDHIPISTCFYVSAQAGRFATAQRLVEEAISVEIEQLNGTDEQMAELYHLNATIQDDVSRTDLKQCLH